jgi:hypothetical protein
MKRGALKFALLEDETALESSNSGLDKIITECRILNAAEPASPLLENCPAESLSAVLGAYKSLLDILAFTQTIDKEYDSPYSPDLPDVNAGMRNAFGHTWMANKMEYRARLVGIQLATWDEIEKDVQMCRDWSAAATRVLRASSMIEDQTRVATFYKTHPGRYEKALTIAQAEYAAESDKLRSENEAFRTIIDILEEEQPTVRLKIKSARNLPKMTKWGVSKVPSPFARLHIDEKELCHTNTVQKTVSP